MIWRTTLATVVLAASWIGQVEAFTVTKKATATIARRGAIWALTATAASTTTTDDDTDIFEQLGIEPGKLALGVRPDEVLKYIGTREALIAKTKADIPTFSLEKATAEADKFLMDAEMLDLYIRFGKEVEKDPNFKVPDPPGESEGLFSVRNIAIAYGSFLLASRGPDLVRGYIADQQVAGTWQPTGLSFLDAWVDDTSAAAMAEALARAAASSATDAAATAATVVEAGVATP